MVSFAHPELLLLLVALAPLILLAVWGFGIKKQLGSILRVPARKIIVRQITKYLFVAGALILLVIAAAGPRMRSEEFAVVRTKTGELAVMIDVSKSMAARSDPLAPSRLERAKEFAVRLTEEFPDAIISVISFTHNAFTLVPFTDDHAYARRTLQNLVYTNSVPGVGTDIARSIFEAADTFSDSGEAKVLIVFSDGERFSANKWAQDYFHDATLVIQDKSITLVAVGVGEPDGTLIPLYNKDGQFEGRYAEYQGVPYKTSLDEDYLKELAQSAGGYYFHEDESQKVVDVISRQLDTALKETSDKQEKDLTLFFLIPGIVLSVVFVRYYFT